MELVASRGKLNGDPMNFPVIEKGVSLRVGSSYARNIFQSRLGPGETQESSIDAYTRGLEEGGPDFEPPMDLFLAWGDSLGRGRKHPMGRVFVRGGGRDHRVPGGNDD